MIRHVGRVGWEAMISYIARFARGVLAGSAEWCWRAVRVSERATGASSSQRKVRLLAGVTDTVRCPAPSVDQSERGGVGKVSCNT